MVFANHSLIMSFSWMSGWWYCSSFCVGLWLSSMA